MKQCTIIGHNGWTDYISQYALRRHFIKDYDRVLLFIDNSDKYEFVRSMYPETTIEICVPETTSNYNGIDSCICCHTLGSPYSCPRTHNTSCRFIDYTKYTNYNHIKLNAFDNYAIWSKFMEGKSFLESMYAYYNLDFKELVLQYKMPIDIEKNSKFFSEFNIKEEYIIVHDNKSTGFTIPISTKYRIIEFNSISNTITNTILLLQNAKEIHCIDSVYLFLILVLSLQYNYFQEKPISLYYRSNDTNGPFIAIKQFLPVCWNIYSL